MKDTTIAILTFDGFNEIDSLVALHILGRAKDHGMRPLLTSPAERVTSMNGVTVHAQASLEDLRAADAVLIGSGRRTRDIVQDAAFLERIDVDPSRQLVGAQCSGALVAAALGLLGERPACTDRGTAPWLVERGVRVLEQPFVAHGNMATAGGCLSAVYLASWFLVRLAGESAAREALAYVAPVGDEAYVNRVIDVVRPYVA
jgi:transcriptional regulator GlxA family with amidase domain